MSPILEAKDSSAQNDEVHRNTVISRDIQDQNKTNKNKFHYVHRLYKPKLYKPNNTIPKASDIPPASDHFYLGEWQKKIIMLHATVRVKPDHHTAYNNRKNKAVHYLFANYVLHLYFHLITRAHPIVTSSTKC